MGISFDSEKDFEDCLMANTEFLAGQLSIGGFNFYRQVRLGGYGIADIVGIRSYRDESGICIDVHIIELKNTTLSPAHLAQVARYKHFFDEVAENQPIQMDVQASLIGKKTFPTSDDFVYLCQSIPWVQVYEFRLDPMSGLSLDVVSGWTSDSDSSEDERKFFATAVRVMTDLRRPETIEAEFAKKGPELVYSRQAAEV
jgi:hypothetical protein